MSDSSFAAPAFLPEHGPDNPASQKKVLSGEEVVPGQDAKESVMSVGGASQNLDRDIEANKVSSKGPSKQTEEIEITQQADEIDSWKRLDASHKLEEEQEVGWRTEVRHLYTEGLPDGDGTIRYTDVLPTKVRLKQKLYGEEQKTKDFNKTFAIVDYHEVSGDTMKATEIEIQNQELRLLLSDIFEGYPEVDTEVPRLVFHPPFIPFAHRWYKVLEAEQKKEEGKERRKMLLTLLKDTFSKEVEDSVRALQDFRKTGYIDYQNILVALEPGDTILHSKDGRLSAGVLTSARKVETHHHNHCVLEVEVIDWDGQRCGYRTLSWSIDQFDGSRHMTKLSCFPLRIHSEKERIRAKLIKRGKTFEELRGQFMKQYGGVVVVEGGFMAARRSIRVAERIIVDAAAWYQFQGEWMPELKALKGAKEFVPKWLQTSSKQDGQDEKDLPLLTDEQCILAVPTAKGFALESKKWYEFDVDSIESIVWNEGIFDSLVLKMAEKELLLALVERSRDTDDENDKFDDFIEGKGKSLILLLGGPPGVGKTLTAESVAEQLKRPLYRVRARDLGISASSVESSLKEALDHCSHWNAVLLVDEADVFLQRRSSDSLSRNQLVSTFLVLLEYYNGVLILTTNRSGSLDPAFESRIDIVLKFDDLDINARRNIWFNFVNTLPKSTTDISSKDLDTLSKWTLNGRQIKSAIKTAQILATKNRQPLSMVHLEVVLSIRKRGSELLQITENQWPTNSVDMASGPSSTLVYLVKAARGSTKYLSWILLLSLAILYVCSLYDHRHVGVCRSRNVERSHWQWSKPV